MAVQAWVVLGSPALAWVELGSVALALVVQVMTVRLAAKLVVGPRHDGESPPQRSRLLLRVSAAAERTGRAAEAGRWRRHSQETCSGTAEPRWR